MTSRSNQLGVSLVELMIAMVLGLIVIGGVVAIFVGAAASFNVKQGLDRSQENLRFVVPYLVHELRQAARIRDEDGFASPIAAVSVDNHTAANQQISLRYTVPNDDDAIHCDGTFADARDVLEKTFSVDNSGALTCASRTLARDAGKPAISTAAEVAAGVVRIRIDEWIETLTAPAPYRLETYSDLSGRQALADANALNEDYDAGFGLVGVRLLVELDHIGAETMTFVTTVALRNAVLEWFTEKP